jgi:hypothetical protein
LPYLVYAFAPFLNLFYTLPKKGKVVQSIIYGILFEGAKAKASTAKSRISLKSLYILYSLIKVVLFIKL